MQKDRTEWGSTGGTYVDRDANQGSKRYLKRIVNAVECSGLHKWFSDGSDADPDKYPGENFIDIFRKSKPHRLS